MFLEDETCVLQYAAFPEVDPNQELTAASIGRFSQRDAEMYLWLWNKCQKYWRYAFLEHFFNPAKPVEEPDGIDKLFKNPESGIDPRWVFMSAEQLFQDIFEDPHNQAAFLRAAQSMGLPVGEVGSGFSSLYMIFFYMPYINYAVGGSHVLAHASQRVILENGGKVFTNVPVENVIIKNGKAIGVKLENGSEIEAKKCVITSLDPYQTCIKLIGKEHLSPDISRKIENLQVDGCPLMWYSWAFSEIPKYKAEAWNPDVRECMWTGLADLDPTAFRTEWAERRINKWPSKMNVGVAYHGPTDFCPEDSLLAPPEKNYVFVTEQYTLPTWCLSEKEWVDKQDRYAEDIIELWQKYAPNVTFDNLIGYLAVTPYYSTNMCRNWGRSGNVVVIDNCASQWGRFRPITELAGHKVPNISDLYVTGSGWHPWGSAHSAQGYNCYKVIAEDFGLRKPWEEEDRPF